MATMRCELCGEIIRPTDEAAEMFDPAQPDDESVVCHADCGLSRGYEVA